ncbi:MAG: hypothetical protein IPK66_05960 [Rhodospirillales bacterium]|nr:hypothetical protein [Rhodospirillales bacterium]
MPDIAKLDEDGMLIAVETVTADAHRTDPQAGMVALPDGHDMRQRLKGYRWDFRRHCFLPLTTEPIEVAERDSPELVEALVQAVEHLEEALNVPLPKRSKRALRAYRRIVPLRSDAHDPRVEEPGGGDDE